MIKIQILNNITLISIIITGFHVLWKRFEHINLSSIVAITNF